MRRTILVGVLALVAVRVAHADAPIELLHSGPAVVAVSSTVANPTILPSHLVDGKLDTAWNSRTGQLEGAWIGVRLPAGVMVTAVKLTVGFVKKDPKYGDLFTMNPRIARVAVSHDDRVIVEKKLDPAVRTLQEVALPAGSGGGDYEIEVLEIVPGTKPTWREIGVSEFEVWGTLPAGTAAVATQPIVRIGGFVPTKEECTAAMYPDPKVAATAELVDTQTLVGDLELCWMRQTGKVSIVDDRRSTEVASDFAIVRRGAPLAVVQRKTIPGQLVERPNHDTEWIDDKAEVFPLTTSEVGLLITHTDHRRVEFRVDARDEGTSVSALYRVSATTFAPVLGSVPSSWSSRGPITKESRCTILRPRPLVAALPPALVVSCRGGTRPAGQDKYDTPIETTTTYQWNGTRYVKK